MRKFHIRWIICVFSLITTMVVSAEQQTLFKLKEKGIGGYGGPHYRITSINNQFSIIGGGPHNLLINRSIGLGISWFIPEGDAAGLDIFYGGVHLEYTFFPDSWYHLTLGSMFGGGKLWYKDPDVVDARRYTSNFFAGEPEVMISFNFGRNERFGLGTSYRVIAGAGDIPGVNESSLSGPAVSIRLIYGIFDPDLPNEEQGIKFTGAVSHQFSSFDGQLMSLRGGGTRIIISRCFYIGIGGYSSEISPELNDNLVGMMYGGVWSEYVFNPGSLIELSTGGIVGMGAGGTINEETDGENLSPMLVIDPVTYASLNTTEFMKVTIGIGYRFAYLFDEISNIGTFDLSSISGVIQLRLGGF